MARILLVDDTETYLTLEQRTLGPGHEYLLARNGKEAVNLAKEKLPDIVLMDVSMPLMSGDEATRQLQADPATRGIPVLLISAEAAYRTVAKQLGVAGFISKPFDGDLLVQRVDRVLAVKGRVRHALVVQVGQRRLAVPLDATRELLPMPVLSPLPGAPRHVQGLLNLRGDVIPVFDLPARLGLSTDRAADEQFVLVAQSADRVLGVAVDDADDVVEIESTAFQQVDPEVAQTFGSLARAVVGVWREGEALVPIISPLALLPEAAFERLDSLVPRSGR
jgi:chemotaxis signal transduction protein